MIDESDEEPGLTMKLGLHWWNGGFWGGAAGESLAVDINEVADDEMEASEVAVDEMEVSEVVLLMNI